MVCWKRCGHLEEDHVHTRSSVTGKCFHFVSNLIYVDNKFNVFTGIRLLWIIMENSTTKKLFGQTLCNWRQTSEARLAMQLAVLQPSLQLWEKKPQKELEKCSRPNQLYYSWCSSANARNFCTKYFKLNLSQLPKRIPSNRIQ